jgi:hypothetical protein
VKDPEGKTEKLPNVSDTVLVAVCELEIEKDTC